MEKPKAQKNENKVARADFDLTSVVLHYRRWFVRSDIYCLNFKPLTRHQHGFSCEI